MAFKSRSVSEITVLIFSFGLLLGNVWAGADTSFEAMTGLGYDSNVFHSPADAYIDLAQTGTPLITPVVQDGLFIPLNFKASVGFSPLDNMRLSGSYHFEGEFYQDNTLDNANQKIHQLKGRLTRAITLQESTEIKVFAGIKFTDQKKIYVDRDTGAEKQSGINDVSNRYEFQGIALEGGLSATVSAWQFGVDGLFEQKDYADPVVVSEYDNNYYRLSADVEHELNTWNYVYGEAGYGRRVYLDRPARNAQGQLVTSNPKREYVYQNVKVGWRFEPRKAATFQIDVRQGQREDEFVGYGNYNETVINVGMLLKPKRQIKVHVNAGYWTRDYPNAFAFDKPTAGASESEGWDGQCKLDWRWSKNMASNALWRYEKDTGSDLRYQFERTVITMGMEYTM